jgi:hypothetical protein
MLGVAAQRKSMKSGWKSGAFRARTVTKYRTLRNCSHHCVVRVSIHDMRIYMTGVEAAARICWPFRTPNKRDHEIL